MLCCCRLRVPCSGLWWAVGSGPELCVPVLFRAALCGPHWRPQRCHGLGCLPCTVLWQHWRLLPRCVPCAVPLLLACELYAMLRLGVRECTPSAGLTQDWSETCTPST